MKREVFHHAAYEVYPDLLAAARDLVPMLATDARALARRFVELDREAHARNSRPLAVPPAEAEHVRTWLAAWGITDVSLPDAPAEGKWRFLVRSLDRLERVRELGGPVDMLREAFLRGAYDLAPTPYVPPGELVWTRTSDLVHDAIMLTTATGEEIGIGDEINALPEAAAFFAKYPQAYAFWEIHGYADPDEDPDVPEPLRFPEAIWTAAAITLAEHFADTPVASDGPATFQPPDREASPYLHPALAAACKDVASRRNVLVGWVEVHP
jgi:hypothetical protein